MRSVGEPAQFVEGHLGLLHQLVEVLAHVLGPIGEARLEQSEPDPQRDQVLRGAVMKVALQALPLGVGRLLQALVRIDAVGREGRPGNARRKGLLLVAVAGRPVSNSAKASRPIRPIGGRMTIAKSLPVPVAPVARAKPVITTAVAMASHLYARVRARLSAPLDSPVIELKPMMRATARTPVLPMTIAAWRWGLTSRE